MSTSWAPLPAPPTAPQPDYVAPPPNPLQKPSTFYKVLGIIQIVLGIAGVVYALFSIGMTAFASTYASRTAALYDGPTLLFMYLRLAVSILTGAALLATGIGVVRAKRWARPVGVAYAVTSLLNTLGSTMIQILVIQPRMYAHMGALSGVQGLEAFFIASALFGVAVAAVVPVVTLVALLRERAKEELDG